MTLEEYFRKHKEIIDHAVRVDERGPFIHFYIHGAGKNSDTPDFIVIGNELRPLPKPETCDHPIEYAYSYPITNAVTKRTIQGRYCLCGKNLMPDLKP